MQILKIATGVDIEENSRFEKYTKDRNCKFLNRIFTKEELDYCFRFKNPASHLCARYCAKEATIKALFQLGVCEKKSYKSIEVIKNGLCPEIRIDKAENVELKLSLSHCKSTSVASVVAVLKMA